MSNPIDESSLVTRFLGRRRVFAIVAIWLLVLIEVAIQEGDDFLHSLDDIGVVVIAAVVIVLVYAWRHRTSLAELKKQTNIITGLFVVALALKLFAMVVEFGDAGDFGDEIPLFILMVVMVANRFA